MRVTGLALADAAQTLIGVPFRLHGRDPDSGLDCVGLLAVALARSGSSANLPNGYALRSRQRPDLAHWAEAAGFATVNDGCILPGDIIVTQPAPCQIHLAIAAAAGGLVHAHAGLGRVVLSPAPLPWPVTGQWRLLPPR